MSEVRSYFSICVKSLSSILSVFLILICGEIAQAQVVEYQGTAPWMAKAPCKDTPERNAILSLGGHEFILCYDFAEKELTPSHYVKLTITSYAPKGAPKLDIINFGVAAPALQPGVIVEGPSGPHEHHTELTSQTSYRYSLHLEQNLKPEPYQMKLVVSQNSDSESLYFYMPMGAGNGDWLEPAKGSQKWLECWSGHVCDALTVTFLNKLPYNIRITQISATSEPSDLLIPHASPSPQELKKGLSPQPVSITLEAKSISFFRALRGLKVPKAFLNISYQDQYAREFFQQVEIGLEVRPHIILLVVTLVLGAVAGTIVRFDVGRLEKAGIISKKQRRLFAATTLVAGIFVCLIALFADLKLVVFADQSTYSAWDPKMLFLTSLIGTVGGIPILYGLLKLSTTPNANLPNGVPAPETVDKQAPEQDRQ